MVEIQLPDKNNFAQVDTNFTELRFPINPRVRLEYENVEVVFVPGAGQGPNIWDLCSHELNENYGIQSVALELRGPSDWRDQDINKQTLKSDMQTIQDALIERAKGYAKEKRQLLVTHSKSGLEVFKMLSEGMIPDTVGGIIFLNPVPPSTSLKTSFLLSSTKAMHGGFFGTSIPKMTPPKFAWSVLRGRVGEFFKEEADAMHSIFFSSEDRENSRIAGNLPIEEFCERYTFPESRQTVIGMMLPTSAKPQSIRIPTLILGSENDRLISPKATRQMYSSLQKASGQKAQLVMEQRLSHQTQIDVDYQVAIQKIREYTQLLADI